MDEQILHDLCGVMGRTDRKQSQGENMIKFIEESNRIEGILRPPTKAEIVEMEWFMTLPEIKIYDLKKFVSIYQPNAILRDKPYIPGVQVGNHVAPSSGPRITSQLNLILDEALCTTPYLTHQAYETLHPFTDGNGRSGRALWAWQMRNLLGEKAMDVVWQRGFLHSWYYQSLENTR